MKGQFMLKHERQNIHHRTIPKNGSIGRILGLENNGIDPKRRCIVVAFPVTDGAIWNGKALSLGIHTIFVRFLDNHQITRISAHWFNPDN
jgi:hypothetical protein